MEPRIDLKKRILIVEDEGLIAADIQNRLRRLGYPSPATARSGEEAMQLVGSGPFDLVLMDIRLKGEMDGITTAEALKASHELPIVYVTAHADQETIQRAKVTEPYGYVIKPIDDESLRSTVEIAIYKHDMDRRLRDSRAWLSTTLRSIGDGVIAVNPSGDIVFMNPVAEHLTGWTAVEVFGKSLTDVVALFEESTDRPAPNPTSNIVAGEIRTYTLIGRNGEKSLVEVVCSDNVSADGVRGAIMVVREISARRELEERMLQSQKMETVANLAGGLAHDFNNQLMIILGYAEELSKRLSSPDKEMALETRHATSMAISLTHQLLTLSRHDIRHLELVDINEAICDLQPIISQCFGKAGTLVTELGTTIGSVRADRNQLKQVLLNLALNARDAMPGGGEFGSRAPPRTSGRRTRAARLYRPGLLRSADNRRFRARHG